MIGRDISRMVAVLMLAAAFAGRSSAQSRIEVGAAIGHYAPLGSFRSEPVYSTSLPSGPSDLAGMALGGDMQLWVMPRIGFAFSGMTVSSRVGGGATPNGYDRGTRARITMGAAQMLFRVTGENSRARVWLGAGGGVVQHGGNAYAQYGKPVNYGPVVGAGFAIRLTKELSADLGVTSMIYDMNMSAYTLPDRPAVAQRGRQVDMIVHTGLSYRWY